MGMGNVVLPPLVMRYFADRVGTLSTLYLTVLQLGTILPALVAVPVAAAVGWRISIGGWNRKSIGKGKAEQVRVDLGGRRYGDKKIRTQTYGTHDTITINNK